MNDLYAHSRGASGVRHLLADHARATGDLARRFAEPFGAGELAWALGLLHDAGKADCAWQDRLSRAEATGGKVGGPHWELGAKLLLRVADRAALAVYGHHGGLTHMGNLKDLMDADDEPVTRDRLLAILPEMQDLLAGSSLVPDAWKRDSLVLDIGVRLAFSALVDADHLDTAAHFAGATGPRVAPASDMDVLVRRFEGQRDSMLAERRNRVGVAPVDCARAQLYDEVVGSAAGPTGVYRLPAPTGSGKTITAAGFALHHAARHGKSQVIVAVPFLTITEQNAQVYRDLLGDDIVLEHHSQVDLDNGDHRVRLAAENWDAPFVVTTTVQLFESLFGRKPSRSRKLHRLANAVVVLDEVQALPLPVLLPILDGLRVLTEHFGTTVVLTSATQPSFHRFEAWSSVCVRELVERPADLFEHFQRVSYEWRTDPKPTFSQMADEINTEPQALIVVNTVAQARQMYELLVERGAEHVLHLSTRMCPQHRRDVLATVREMLTDGKPIVLVSTQLIEAGVDVDFPVVFRAMAPAESLQQAGGRANREGRLAGKGRVIIFDAVDTRIPDFYRTAVSATQLYFGPDRADPDDLRALDLYYADLYLTSNAEHGERAQEIQRWRQIGDFESVAEGRLVDVAGNRRRRDLAFRMIDEETVPVVVTHYPDAGRVNPDVEALLVELADPERRSRRTFRKLQPFTAAVPKQFVDDPVIGSRFQEVAQGLELCRWAGMYDKNMGICEWAKGEEISQ